jgi:hypothetical protein
MSVATSSYWKQGSAFHTPHVLNPNWPEAAYIGDETFLVPAKTFLQSLDKVGRSIHLNIAVIGSAEIFHTRKNIGRLCTCAI